MKAFMPIRKRAAIRAAAPADNPERRHKMNDCLTPQSSSQGARAPDASASIPFPPSAEAVEDAFTLAVRLLSAAEDGRADLVAQAIENGAKLAPFGINHETALMAAAQKGHAECVRLILSAFGAAAANELDIDGENAMHKAIRGSSAECVKALAPFADLSARTRMSGWTPLMMACTILFVEAVEILVPLSDLGLKSNRSLSAEELATEWAAANPERGARVANVFRAERARRERESLAAAIGSETRPDAPTQNRKPLAL
jgi:ankyrin repeat protein